MTEYITICVTAFLGSGLTLFSGFGLGTILVPVFTLFFPVELAIALTAIVHFLNNLFKLLLLGNQADKNVVLKFGVPAVLAAFAGALLLTVLAGGAAFYSYEIGVRTFVITPVKLTVAVLLVIFVLLDLLPALNRLAFDKKFLLPGGLLSGFFGGLTGNQGALRSAFLIKAGLTKESFIATGVVIACMVDTSRLIVYWNPILNSVSNSTLPLLSLACLSAFCGAYAGSRMIKKITLPALQKVVAILLLIFALLLGAGLV